ncbi:RNA polymerase sigma-70 factor, ECF subfamily [Micromonospora echinaurantiaca]|uniref:RNA polymerase sigma-70 factor, ECF subfamily n=1 Tax=Micromonospora echinaurantiaca TaxID=47857 RepID=A0A1C5IH19_9ACTN|nr:RNA polymerase sigma-70 factor, ECF subfamily [Micromonospora echinaurantiaca]
MQEARADGCGTAEFDAFYTATAVRVVGHVFAVYGDLADAQDVVQEAYAKAWQHWHKVSAYADPEAWVRVVAWRLAANRWRSARRRARAWARRGEPPPTPGPGPDRVAIVRALQQLPIKQRQVVVLHYLYGYPVAEIAESTGMPVGSVKAYLHRARARLAVAFGEGAGLEERSGDGFPAFP